MRRQTVFIILPYLGRPPFELNRSERIHRERRLTELTRQEGYRCTLYLPTYGPPTRERDAVGAVLLPVDRPDLDRPHRHISSMMLQEVEREKPDLVVFKGMGYKLNSWMILTSRHRFRVALIAAGGARDPITPFADYVLAETQEQVDRYLAPELPRSRVAILPKLTALARHPQTVTKDIDIVNVGSFTENKNQLALIPLARRYRIALIGHGSLWSHVKSAAEPYGDRISMPGNLPRDSVPDYLSRSRLMVHCARSEGVPRAVMEAFSCGVPVVASRRAMPGAFEHGVQGLLVEPDELLDAARELLEDPDRLAAMGRAAREFAAARCNEEAVFAPVRRMYETVFAADPVYRGSMAQIAHIQVRASRMAVERWAKEHARRIGLRRLWR